MVTWGGTTILGPIYQSSNAGKDAAPRNILSFNEKTPLVSTSNPEKFSFPSTQLDNVTSMSQRLTSNTTNEQISIPHTLVPFSKTSSYLESSPTMHKIPIPQQAALQAHIDATLYQEATRLQSILQNIFLSYSSYTHSRLTNSHSSPQGFEVNPLCSFQHIMYDEIADQTVSYNSDRVKKSFNIEKDLESNINIFNQSLTSRPHHINLETWSRAQYRNPDPDKFIPTILTGAESLHYRIVTQDTRAKIYKKHLFSLKDTYKTLKETVHTSQRAIERAGQINAELTRNLLTLIKKIEFARCAHLSLQPSEKQFVQRLVIVSKLLEKSHQLLECIRADSEAYITKLSSSAIVDKFDCKHLDVTNKNLYLTVFNILNREGKGINLLNDILQKDKRDVDIIKSTDSYFSKSITSKNI